MRELVLICHTLITIVLNLWTSIFLSTKLYFTGKETVGSKQDISASFTKGVLCHCIAFGLISVEMKYVFISTELKPWKQSNG